MPSIGSYYLQRPTNNLILNGSGVSSGTSVWFAYFAQSDFDDWLAANGSTITNLGDLYVIPGTVAGETFYDVLRGANGATELSNSGQLGERYTVLDLGKEIIIGNSVNSKMLVFRLVQFPGVIANGGLGASSYYVVIQNNTTDLNASENARFRVAVSRI